MKQNNPLKVAIVNSSSFGMNFPEHLRELTEVADISRVYIPNDSVPELYHNLLYEMDAIIASVTPSYSEEVLRGLPNLQLLARHGVGCDNVDLEAATKFGIAVSKCGPEVEAESVAQMTMSLIDSASREILTGYQAVHEGRWADRAHLRLGIDLHGCTVGLIGIGAIGSTVARILHSGYGARVLAYDPFVSREEVEKRHARKVELKELLETSRIVSIHCPRTQQTERMLGTEEFRLMQSGTILVNTTRGEILQQDALIAALQSGKVRTYATDVVEGEPIGADHPLLKLGKEKVIITPHLGGYSELSLKGMGQVMVNDILAMMSGQLPGVLANTGLEAVHSRISKRGNRVQIPWSIPVTPDSLRKNIEMPR